MASNEILPPLPPSDEEALSRNKFDGYYEVRARDFWGGNKVNRFEEPKQIKCEHEFELAPGGAKCQKCHVGYQGELEVREGKLFYKGEQIKI